MYHLVSRKFEGEKKIKEYQCKFVQKNKNKNYRHDTNFNWMLRCSWPKRQRVEVKLQLIMQILKIKKNQCLLYLIISNAPEATTILVLTSSGHRALVIASRKQLGGPSDARVCNILPPLKYMWYFFSWQCKT